MNEEDLKALEAAVQLLETPGLAARLTDMVGKPIELIGKAMPASVSQEITAAALNAIKLALKAALLTMRRKPKAASKLLHKALATATGAAGGAFGLPALPVELPISTLIMFRSIADIARSEGENLPPPKLRSRAWKSSRWAAGLHRPTLLKADILWCEPLLPRA